MIQIKNFILWISLTIFTTQFAFSQDWPNLKRYEKENSALTMPQPNEDRVVFMGNSITEGWLNILPGFFADKPYINRGIGGQTTPQMLVRFRQDVIKLKPSAVVILAGINDIAGNTGPSSIEMIADNIFSMAELAKAHNIKVVLCSVLPANHFPWQPDIEPAQKVIDLNSILKTFAAENNIAYADYFSEMVNELNGLKEELGSDGVHPNEKGYSIMEPIIQNSLKDILKKE